jgi:putative endonuclease
MIKNSFNNLYIGVTDNPTRRLSEHNSKRGADFTKFKNTFQIVFLEQYQTLTQARQREIQIKKWSRSKKEMLISRYRQGLETKK